MGGVLKSWALPKQMSYDPKIKRMAVLVEDHPVAYSDFEGLIPQENYGGGPMIIWDEGVYAWDEDGPPNWVNRDASESACLAGLSNGKIGITFKGTKMKGSWALVQTKEGWLMIKHADAFSQPERDDTLDLRSVRTGRTAEEIAQNIAPFAFDLTQLEGAKQALMPPKPQPMLMEEAPAPFDREGWTFEAKLDGIRILATGEEGLVKLWTRNGNDIASKYLNLCRQLSRIPFRTWMLDGELVKLDADGKANFSQLLETFTRSLGESWNSVGAPAEFCVFDVLYLEGYSLAACPLFARKKVLDAIKFRSPQFKKVDSFPTIGKTVFELTASHGFEGIVAKRLDSKYKFGSRESCWLKYKKSHTEEFVVAGIDKGEGVRARTFGSLLLGRKTEDGLQYVGSVGSGFTDDLLNQISESLAPLKTKESPFFNVVDDKVLSNIEYVEPKIWVEVRYQEMGTGGHLRFPVFLNLRPDVGDGLPLVEAKEEVMDPVAELDAIKKDGHLRIEGYQIAVTNLNKILWPETEHFRALTKRDLIRYYIQVHKWMLPQLKDRPISWVRFPEGIHGESFYQKHWEQSKVPYLKEVPIWSQHNQASPLFVMVDNLATLVWLGQLATLEIHPWYSRITPEDGKAQATDFGSSEQALDSSILDCPDFMVFDLDPYIYAGTEKPGEEPALNDAAFRTTVKIALSLKELLEQMGLPLFAKTTGKTGLHLFLPIERNVGYDAVRALARTIGETLALKFPGEITLDYTVANRTGKIFFDYNQNVRGKTLASIFSPRPSPNGSVSFPVRWEALPEIYPSHYNILNVPDLLSEGHSWEHILDHKIDLLKLLGK